MKICAVEHYILIGIYVFLFALVNINVWQIIIKQKRYKTWLLLAFYTFAYIAISFRLIILIFGYLPATCLRNIDSIQPGAKICAGLIQVWIIIEITLHLRNAN